MSSGGTFLKVLGGVALGAVLVVMCLMTTCFLVCGKTAHNIAKMDEAKKSYLAKMEINDDFTWSSEDNYSYIRGRVTNKGDKVVRYWKIMAKYYGKNGEVLDTDITNSTDTLRPKESKSFEIMHRNDSAYKRVSVEVEEVSLASE